jgi:hypothetical protein
MRWHNDDVTSSLLRHALAQDAAEAIDVWADVRAYVDAERKGKKGAAVSMRFA